MSAYALFFRDTQAAIKGQNPNASFGEVSKIVASMWDGLDSEHKSVSIRINMYENEILCCLNMEYLPLYYFQKQNIFVKQVYKQKTEVAKKEYLKALAAYRASLVSKVMYNQTQFWKSPKKLFSNIFDIGTKF